MTMIPPLLLLLPGFVGISSALEREREREREKERGFEEKYFPFFSSRERERKRERQRERGFSVLVFRV